MQPQDLEPEMEALLQRLVPGSDRDWVGATDEEIAQVQALCKYPLPRFYLWFLKRMGRSMGVFSYPRLDFSARTVISRYAEEYTDDPPDEYNLVIGYDSTDIMPFDIYYDFRYPARDDARVAKAGVYVTFDTLREMIAWGNVYEHRINVSPQRCSGLLIVSRGNVFSYLDPVMESMGLTRPIPTGDYRGVYEGERSHASMICTNAHICSLNSCRFTMGGQDAGLLRRILGEVVAETAIEVMNLEWNPPLP